MSSTVTYSCPNCGAGLVFDAEKQKFACEFCLSEFTEEELDTGGAAEEAERQQKQSEEYCNGMNAYICSACGAEVVADETTAADFCAYCHNPVVLSGKLSGQMRPHKIIPFQYDKKEAEKKFLDFCRKKWFLPRDFFSPGQAEKIAGVYFPFWVTDADTNSRMTATATKVRTWRRGDTQYTETSTFDISRGGFIHFEDIVTSALSEADKEMLEGVLPYPSDSMMDFSMPYLSGFVAKKRDIERESLNDEIRKRMHDYATTLLSNTVHGYSTVTPIGTDVNVTTSHWEYTLMPIWMLTYQKGSKRFLYAMNGHTGKIYGKLPVSLPKLSVLFASVSAGLFTLLFLLGGLL